MKMVKMIKNYQIVIYVKEILKELWGKSHKIETGMRMQSARTFAYQQKKII